jgi:1-acyl-sn-glycerol-3-phosphate acyltransferase
MIKYLGLLFKIACPVLEIRHTAKKYLKHPERNQNGEFFYYIQRKIKKVIDKRIKVKWIISGQENIPADSNYLLVGNHQSNFDPVFLVAESKKEMTFVSKKENFDFFFLTPILTALNCIPRDRSSLKDEVRAIKAASEFDIPMVVVDRFYYFRKRLQDAGIYSDDEQKLIEEKYRLSNNYNKTEIYKKVINHVDASDILKKDEQVSHIQLFA